MATEAIRLSAVVPASPRRVYDAWLDERTHAAITNTAVRIDPVMGGRFTTGNGYVSGQTLWLDPGRLIIQSWRSQDFPENADDSRIEITFEPDADGTRVVIVHRDIPVGQADSIEEGWRSQYLEPIQAWFAERRDEANEPTGAEDESGTPIPVGMVERDEEGADAEPLPIRVVDEARFGEEAPEAPAAPLRKPRSRGAPKGSAAKGRAAKSGAAKKVTGRSPAPRRATAAGHKKVAAKTSAARKTAAGGRAKRTATRAAAAETAAAPTRKRTVRKAGATAAASPRRKGTAQATAAGTARKTSSTTARAAPARRATTTTARRTPARKAAPAATAGRKSSVRGSRTAAAPRRTRSPATPRKPR